MFSQTLKFLSLSCLSLVIPSVLLAQKMDKPQIDKFTNDTTLLTTRASIAKKDVGAYYQQLEIYCSKTQGEVTLHLIVDLPQREYYRYRIAAGSAILLKLADNALISLRSPADLISVTGAEKGGQFNQGISTWTVDIGLELSTQNLQRLSKVEVTAVRIPTDRSNIDMDLNSGDRAILQNMVLLIASAK
ncbi:MAG: hypothetical protein JSU01_16620 [Bacteroidetes bacterium]|nr:hypothetical protein [Bacteroidota bacterium]